ncbi:MAG: class I SAM-dependent methyltransferase, partial [Cucumibacter sp.]
AQERHVDKLLSLLPPPPARVLDVGGGTGEMAARLAGLGYTVEMITPSATQAGLARQRLGGKAKVIEARFEAFEGEGPYEVCLWSESFQYVPMRDSLPRTRRLIVPGGTVVIADCFRRESFAGGRAPGGGHRWPAFLEAAGAEGFEIVSDEDVTEAVAPSMLLDQKFYREFAAPVVAQLSGSLKARRPIVHGLLSAIYRLAVGKAKREALDARLRADYRSPEAFISANCYRFMKLRPVAAEAAGSETV